MAGGYDNEDLQNELEERRRLRDKAERERRERERKERERIAGATEPLPPPAEG